jgi:hypothetical protein
MRTLAVTEVRNKLLSGLFKESPQDLEVSGEVTSSGLTITVRDKRSRHEAKKSMKLAERDLQAVEEELADDVDPDTASKKRVSEDAFFGRVSEAAFSKKLTEDEFEGKTESDAISSIVKEKIQTLSSEVINEFFAAKKEE